jgi:uncharacterized membrane protein YidH (DUF202 family)
MFTWTPPIHNSSEIYAEGVTSSLLAAERTYLAWVRTIISVVGFGLVLARYFSPTNAIGSFVTFVTTAVSGLLLYMATERYFHIIWMLDHKKFDADRLTPFLVTSLLGCLLALVIFGCAYTKMAQQGCIKKKQEDDSDSVSLSNDNIQSSRRSIRRRGASSRRTSDSSTGSNNSRLESLLSTREEKEIASLTAVLTADAIS